MARNESFIPLTVGVIPASVCFQIAGSLLDPQLLSFCWLSRVHLLDLKG